MELPGKLARGDNIHNFLADASDGQIIWQLMLMGAVLALGLLTATLVRRWTTHRAPALAPKGVRTRLIEVLLIELPFVVALFALLIARTVVVALDSPVTLLDVAMQLAAALILVRLGLYLLRLALGERPWLLAWEARLTLIVWLLICFELIGWFDGIESTLDSINLLPGSGRFTLWALIKGLVIITAFVLVAQVVARTIDRRVMHVEALALSTRIGITKFTNFFLISLGVLLGINAAGVDLTALTVLTGAIGLGLGFGLQSIASNFVSGFVLLMDRSIKPGDVISFTGQPGTNTESFGWVQALRGRYVVVRDRDGVETLVPNQNLIVNPVINWSYSDRKVRLKLPVRVSYQDDPEEALVILARATEGHPRILRDPAPVTRLMQFNDHGMDLELRFWIADPEGGVNNVRSDVNRAIWRLFRDAGITIPVAQREVVIRSAEIPR